MNIKDQLNNALEQAKMNNIEAVEVWIPERLISEFSSEITNKDDGRYLGELRVRSSNEEFIRIGRTTCPFGPGKT